MKDIADIRQDYQLAELDEQTVGIDPILFFTRWFSEAQKAEISEINAMTLATVGEGNIPHARIVLLKGLDGDLFEFYTNYNSAKGHDIDFNPNVCLVFFWKELERQVRIQGKAEKLEPGKSDAYFNSRPIGSRLGAWSSPQSSIIQSRDILDENYKHFESEFSGKTVSRPEHWGGYAVNPSSIEFWQGRSSRMHDRILFKRNGEMWTKERLAP